MKRKFARFGHFSRILLLFYFQEHAKLVDAIIKKNKESDPITGNFLATVGSLILF